MNSRFIVKNGVELRTGYTTGSCAAAAASAAARMLLNGEPVREAVITLPNGETATFEIINAQTGVDFAACSVIKDAGDDPDVTDGIEIRAECRFCDLCDEGAAVKGGEGVGVVTRPGLRRGVGEAAINPVPLAMIKEAIRRERANSGCDKGITVTISAVNGAEIAKRTFNARLGVAGGVSILGTTGIVEPMSEKAVIETIKLDIDRARGQSENLLLSPGNFGLGYCRDALGIDAKTAVKYSNFLGEALDHAVYRGFKRLLLVGHAGKLVKVAGGVMNTHSSVADCRMEIIAAHAACADAGTDAARRIMAAVSVSAALEVLDGIGLTGAVFGSVMEKILFHIDYRVKGTIEAEVIMFADNNRILARGRGEKHG